MQIVDPISGNAVFVRYKDTPIPIWQRSDYLTVEVAVDSVTLQPAVIKYLGKTYKVRMVIGSGFNAELRATEFYIKIGDHRTKIWKTANGAWYIRPNT